MLKDQKNFNKSRNLSILKILKKKKPIQIQNFEKTRDFFVLNSSKSKNDGLQFLSIKFQIHFFEGNPIPCFFFTFSCYQYLF